MMDILIPLFIIIPFSIFIIYLSSDYVMQSYHNGEVSPDPGGLPYRYLVKSLIPIGFILIFIQALAVLFKAISRVAGEK
jgi:TRAP-type mannitol/chloroaromatic compound transport system permease small subunit